MNTEGQSNFGNLLNVLPINYKNGEKKVKSCKVRGLKELKKVQKICRVTGLEEVKMVIKG